MQETIREFFSKNIKLIILLFIIIIISVISITLALTDMAIPVRVGTGDYNVVYTGAATLPSSKLTPINDTASNFLTNNSSKILKVDFTVKGAANNPTHYTDDTEDPIYGTEKNNIKIIYDVSLNDLDIPVVLKNSLLKWRLYKNGSLFNEGDFSDAYDIKKNNRLVLTNSQQDLPKYSSTADSYTFYIWLSEPCLGDITSCGLETDTSIFLNQTISGNIGIELSTGEKKDLIRTKGTNPAYKTLENLRLENHYEGGLEVFTSTSQEEKTNGIYAASDDFGTSYYFRGNVDYNYVKFGKNASSQDMYWRIIRINGDGTVRMIYDGTSLHPNGTTTTNKQIGTSAFNTNYNNNAYVGYMYGTIGASTYDATHKNTSNSTMKTYLDNWYKSVFLGKTYEQYIADAVYCNDRSTDTTSSSYTGINTTTTYYGAYQRLIRNASTKATPSLKCKNSNDRFTKNLLLNDLESNGKLTYAIGLITADELVYSGNYTDKGTSTEIYLYNGENFYWTMTPVDFDASKVALFDTYKSNYDLDYSNYASGVRPVITLTADAIINGSGVINNPFTIE